jgi:hypothetical protein
VTPFGTHVYSNEDQCIATAGSCVITYSRQPPDTRVFAAWHPVVARLAGQHAGKVSILVVIDSGARTPDESQRKLIASAMQRHAQSIERFAFVVEGRGFASAALRSAISLLNLATRTPYRQKVFATLEEAGVWLAPAWRERGSAMDARALSALVQTMRDKGSPPARPGSLHPSSPL